eukprot:m51a1_g270 putative actin binding protein (1085) ;mRNA; f:247246-251973
MFKRSKGKDRDDEREKEEKRREREEEKEARRENKRLSKGSKRSGGGADIVILPMSPGAQLLAPPSQPPPPADKLDADFAALLPELGIPVSKQQEMLTWDAERKWRLLLIHQDKRAADAERHQTGRVRDTPQYFVGALRAEPAVGVVRSLRVCLAGEGVSWVSSFISLGGGDELAAIVESVLRSGGFTRDDKAFLAECALAIKGLANNDAGFQSVANQRVMNLVVGLLGVVDDPEARVVVFQLMAAVSLESHAIVLAAMEEHRQAHRQRSRWSPTISTLGAPWDTNTPEELRTAAMTLVNALVLHPDELSVRMALREELYRNGLRELLAQQRGRSQMLDAQIEAFEDVALEDEYQQDELFRGVDTASPADLAVHAWRAVEGSGVAEGYLAVMRQQYLVCQAQDHGEAVWPVVLAVLRSEEARAEAQRANRTMPDTQYGAAVCALAAKSATQPAQEEATKRLRDEMSVLERRLEVAREEVAAAKKDAAQARALADQLSAAMASAQPEPLSQPQPQPAAPAQAGAEQQQQQQQQSQEAAQALAEAQSAVARLQGERDALQQRVAELERQRQQEAAAASAAATAAPAAATGAEPCAPALPAEPAAAAAEGAAQGAQAPPAQRPVSIVVSAPPPPPPLPGTGHPPGAPPPLPGTGQPPARKAIAEPATKLLQLQWKKVQGSKVKKSFWETVPEPQLADVRGTLARVEKLFAARAPAASPSPNREGGRPPSAAVKGAAAVQLLDTKRSQNVSIMLSRVKATTTEIVRAILAMDESVLSPQFVASLAKAVPTQEEIDMLRAYPEPGALGKPEQFLLQLGEVPCAGPRLEALAFKQQFQQRCDDAAPGLRVLRAACAQLLHSQRWSRMLGVVLALGNFVNAGTARGGCCGFRLESLSALAEVRSAADPRVTLLHALLQGDVAGLRRGVEHVRSAVADVAAAAPGDAFCGAMEAFLQRAEPQVAALDDALTRAQQEYSGMLEYYAAEPTTTPEELFTTVQSFRLLYEKTRKDIKFAREKAAKQQQQQHARPAGAAERAPHARAEGSTEGKMDALLSTLRDTHTIRERRTSRIGHAPGFAGELAAELAKQAERK